MTGLWKHSPLFARFSRAGALPAARNATRIRVKRRYELGSAGLMYVGMTLLIALGAFNSQNNLLFWAFGFALAVLSVSGVVSGSMLMGVGVERIGTSQARVGDKLVVRYRVRNRNRVFPVFALSIEEAGVGMPARTGLISRLLRPRRAPVNPATGPVRTFVGHLGPGQTLVVEAQVDALRRGPVRLGTVVAHSAFPFGLMRKSLRFAQAGTAIVLPRSVRPADGQLGTAGSLDRAASVSAGRGAGDEFHALREYRAGDPPRDIAWRASARRGGLMVRQTSASSPVRLWIVPVLRDRVGSDVRDEATISRAAGLAEAAEARGLEYGMIVPLTGAMTPMRRGAGQLSRVLVDLALLELGADDARGRGTGVPGRAAGRGAVCAMVHAGGIHIVGSGGGDSGDWGGAT